MCSMKIVKPADFGMIFDATQRGHSAEEWQAMTKGVVTREVFIASCIAKGYPSIGFECDGVPIGGVIFDGEAAHIEVLPEYRSRWAFLLDEARAWVFSLKDPIVVRIDAGNEKCLRFMDRNGWRRLSEDATHVTYEMSSRGQAWRRRRERRIGSVSGVPEAETYKPRSASCQSI